MIAPLRRVHRRAWFSLALLLPVAYVAALAARTPIPGARWADADLPDAVLWTDDHALAPLDVTVSLRRPPEPLDGAAPVVVVALEPHSDPQLPDLLLYWTPDAARIDAPLPPRAVLLGAFGGDRHAAFRACEAQRTTAGSAVLYSLAHQRVAAVAPLPAWEALR